MLECKNISIKAGEKELFSCEHLRLKSGLFALVGRNGTGKSTFLKGLSRENKINGEVLFNGISLSQIDLKQMAFQVSIVKSRAHLFGDYPAKDIMMLGRLPYQKLWAIPSHEDITLVNQIASDLGIESLLNKSYNLLSDGEKQMIMVARAFVQDTPIVLLDEPTAFLDLVNRKELLDQLKKLTIKNKKLIIFATHHIEVLPQYCDGVLLIHQQQLKYIEDKNQFIATINNAFELI